MSFEEAKQYLRREDQRGDSLYEHLSRVLLKVIVEKPQDANAMFEQISQELRGTAYSEPVSNEEGSAEVMIADKDLQLEWCSAAAELYGSTESDATEVAYPDLMTESNIYEWAGVSLGRAEAYQLYLAVKKKALALGQGLRFWGKIVGRSGIYYVIQGENTDSSGDNVKLVEGTEGANKYSFWVCLHVGAEWTKLPNLTPEAVIVARKIRRFFTGDLNAPIPSYPPFPGSSEAHLLRAQVAQITSECSVSPGGFYMEDEDTEEGIKAIKKVEDMEETKSLDELKDISAWVHHEVPINVNGRCNQPPSDEARQEGEDVAEELPDLPLLSSISEDEVTDGPAWDVSISPNGPGMSADSIVIVKSLKWPGAFAAAFGNKYINIYCGYGFESSRGVVYKPPAVPQVQPEWMQTEEDDKLCAEEEDEITQPIVDQGEEEEG